MSKLHRAALESELASLQSLIAESADADPLGTLSLRQRVERIEEQLAELGEEKHHADVTLLFYGKPVDGSRGIDAEFAGKALQSYQSALSKHMNSLTGRALGRRGPIPERSLSRMNIVDVVHGSFGFRLEEDNEEAQMFDTSLRDAVAAISQIIHDFSDPSDAVFEQAIEDIDGRTFLSVKSFIELLRNEDAKFRLLEDDNEIELDDAKVERAYQRVERTEVIENDDQITGTLVGVMPVARRFEFNLEGTEEIISGPIDARLSADFLERIENDEQFIGRPWRASVRIRTVRRPDGREKIDYILTGLLHPE
ncbi:MAG: hypothetical protein JJ901_04140 [Erythrobacter sp.]|uniref:hypothetical protein n=1 Tax=Erythrobacter sp. TaxID=1042 RepID=UPI001B15D16F|nr:hypothetical protein [Erythrobacter sp.]MBO6767482.1 hypothetical protein [Erythrobacter sp.]